MKKFNNILLAAVVVLLALPAVAVETGAAKQEAAEAQSAPQVKYEISIDRKHVKDSKNMIEKIETSEAFKSHECSRVKSKQKSVYTYACKKATCQTDELFRGMTQPGVKSSAKVAACPAGCRWQTSCSPFGTYLCCKNILPTQRCPGT